jgi:hypothetical protein
MTKPFGFRQTDTGLLRRCLTLKMGDKLRELRWLPGNLHVFDGIEAIPLSVNMDALPPLSRHEVASGIGSLE